MKKHAKVLRILCSLLLALTILAGCGSQNATDNGNDNLAAAQPTPGSESNQPAAPDKQEENIDIPQYEGYTLLWHDEFDGDSLNTDIWNMEARDPGWTNNELQEYTLSTDNIFVRDGKLVLKAIKTQKNGKDYYTSGKVNSQGKSDFMYGKVVVSAKVPEGKGLWPAIWMMPTDESYYGQWPKCGEIDIMEVLGSQTHIAYCTVHYGEPHSMQQGTKVLEDGSTFASDFHEYSLEWEPGEMRWYIDGELILTVNDWFTAAAGVEKPYPAPFDQTFFVQMNLAVGGDWPGNPDATTDFSKAEFEIDYVRVYQKPYYDTNVKKPEKQFRQPLEDGNLIYNGDFAEAEDLSDDINWKFLLFEGGEGSAEIKDGTMIIKTVKEGTVDYSVQLVQPELPMYRGQKYRITFDARASEPRTMIVCVSAPNVNWIRYFPDTLLDMSTEWQTYTYEFTMTERDDNYGRLEFNMGNKGSTADIYIRNVRVEFID